jgi:hypothetical protein
MVPDRTSGVSGGQSKCFQALKACTMWRAQEELDLVSASQDSQPMQLAFHWEAGGEATGTRSEGRCACRERDHRTPEVW